jgi:ribose transport system ATP-binding protein
VHATGPTIARTCSGGEVRWPGPAGLGGQGRPTDPFLRLSGVSKTYPGVTALDRVSLQVHAGEVVGLVGENGAGKSTLMKILGGVVAPSSGAIHIDGTPYPSLTVAGAIAAGVALVHQELSLFDNLDAASNVFIGREPLYAGILRLVDRRKLHERARPYFDLLGVDFAADTLVAELSIAQRQLLEIAKALSLDSRLLVLDEPTSSLTLTETDRLLEAIGELKTKGVSIIFVSHRLNELVACADRVVVLRDGMLVGELAKQEVSHAAMIRMMIGRDLKALYLPPQAPPGAGVLEIREARTEAYPDHPVSLTLRRGEILGLAGLIGAGRTELARALFGIDRLVAGSLTLEGRAVEFATPRDAISHGVFLVPEDRKRCGLLLDESICENILLPNLPHRASGGLVQRTRARQDAEDQKARLGIRAPDVDVAARTLSGGNQQKVVLAKWLSLGPRVLVCDEPTRGVDVGAKSEIYRMLRDLADAGVSILMISSDMEEVIGVSDRIAVMHEGAISGFLERSEFSEQKVLRLAVGDRSN